MTNQSSRTDDSVLRMYGSYSKAVFRAAYAITKNPSDSEDITQEVFLRYLKRPPTFNDSEHEKAWFLRVAINLAKNHMSSSWFRRTIPYDDKLSGGSVTMEEKSEVFYAVAQLPEHMRICIHLFYYEEYKVDEIAALLDKSSSGIKSTLMRARERLAKTLQKQKEELFDHEEQ